jgi:hypothetical protein
VDYNLFERKFQQEIYKNYVAKSGFFRKKNQVLGFIDNGCGPRVVADGSPSA